MLTARRCPYSRSCQALPRGFDRSWHKPTACLVLSPFPSLHNTISTPHPTTLLSGRLQLILWPSPCVPPSQVVLNPPHNAEHNTSPVRPRLSPTFSLAMRERRCKEAHGRGEAPIDWSPWVRFGCHGPITLPASKSRCHAVQTTRLQV